MHINDTAVLMLFDDITQYVYRDYSTTPNSQ